jgi:hypothetical protein
MSDNAMPRLNDFAAIIHKVRGKIEGDIIFRVSKDVYAFLKMNVTGREWEPKDAYIAMGMMGAHFVHDETLTGNQWRLDSTPPTD